MYFSLIFSQIRLQLYAIHDVNFCGEMPARGSTHVHLAGTAVWDHRVVCHANRCEVHLSHMTSNQDKRQLAGVRANHVVCSWQTAGVRANHAICSYIGFLHLCRLASAHMIRPTSTNHAGRSLRVRYVFTGVVIFISTPTSVSTFIYFAARHSSESRQEVQLTSW
jgi:hypothetical protein